MGCGPSSSRPDLSFLPSSLSAISGHAPPRIPHPRLCNRDRTLYLPGPRCGSVLQSASPGPQGKRASVAARWGQQADARAPPSRSALETRVQALETQQQAELASLRGEKERLRRLLGRQSGALAGLERSLRAASSNSSLLQRQQRQLLESVQRLVRVVAQGPGERAGRPERCGRRGGDGTGGDGRGREGSGGRPCLPSWLA